MQQSTENVARIHTEKVLSDGNRVKVKDVAIIKKRRSYSTLHIKSDRMAKPSS